MDFKKLFFRVSYLLTVALMFFYLNVNAQDTPPPNKASNTNKLIREQAGRPDLPGDLTIELGLNYLMDTPEGMDMNLWGSKTFNAYYQYPLRIAESGFYFFPGLGIATEKYAFKDAKTIGYVEDDLGNDVLQIIELDTILPDGVKKSKIANTYIEVPIELRWNLKKNDPKRSFKVILGAKIGYLIDSKTKIKYQDMGETKITKQKEGFNLSELRYGIYGKVGYGSFTAFYYYSLSPLFQSNKGPSRTTAAPMIFGISLALF